MPETPLSPKEREKEKSSSKNKKQRRARHGDAHQQSQCSGGKSGKNLIPDPAGLAGKIWLTKQKQGPERVQWVGHLLLPSLTTGVPSSISALTQWKERTYSHKQSLDFHMCTVAHTYPHSHKTNKGKSKAEYTHDNKKEDRSFVSHCAPLLSRWNFLSHTGCFHRTVCSFLYSFTFCLCLLH